MIVVGTMDWPKTKETGEFFCPSCESIQAFRHRQSRPFLTIYFIPVIPIGGLQEYVECRKCKTSFEPSIVHKASSPTETTFASDLIQVAALTMLEDQHVSEQEIAQAMLAVRLIGQVQVPREELGHTCSVMRSKQRRLVGFLWTERERWSRSERLSILQVAFLVASAEGKLSPARMKALTTARSILDVSETDFENSIVEAEQLILAQGTRE